MEPFFIYREPFADVCHCYRQAEEPERLMTLADLDGHRGLVIAPFADDGDCHLYLLNGASGHTVDLPMDGREGFQAIPDWEDDRHLEAADNDLRRAYHEDFVRFHAELERETFRKLVLARSVTERKSAEMTPRNIFLNACKMYPRQYVALFYTRQTGMWLVASPEILLNGDRDGYRTMALAGTMRYDGEGDMVWSDKNKEEQRLVADYIRTGLQPFATELTESAPFTAQAADLAHLRTDFAFSLRDSHHLGHFLASFHPTPAVCGMPKDTARHFILSYEHLRRGYYSGFTGLLGSNGEARLYVTLRCMQLTQSTCCLYAGGGLLKGSIEENEWQETEAKLATMRKLLRNHPSP
ncbi:MAG: isochorismate synthase [Prevotella sp.]|nr:isochorismate synthase [Prevotella sp.]